MSRSGLSAGLGVAVILATASCGGSTASPSTSSVQWSLHTITPGVLTIATYGSAPPLITVGPGANDIGGLSGGWAKAFAAAAHCIDHIAFDRRIESGHLSSDSRRNFIQLRLDRRSYAA